MLTAREASIYLYGAYRLARMDEAGFRFFDASISGFWRSFYAAVIVAPPYLLLILLQRSREEETVPFVPFLAVEAISYVVAWFAFPFLMYHLSQALQRDHRYIRYVVAYNWAQVLQNGLYLPIAILAVGGVLPADAAQFFAVVVMAAIVAYSWFIARRGLDIGGFAAAGIVVADLALGVLIRSYTNSLLSSG